MVPKFSMQLFNCKVLVQNYLKWKKIKVTATEPFFQLLYVHFDTTKISLDSKQ